MYLRTSAHSPMATVRLGWRFHGSFMVRLPQVSAVRQEEVKMSTEEVNKLLSDIQAMKGKQENIDTRIMTMRQ